MKKSKFWNFEKFSENIKILKFSFFHRFFRRFFFIKMLISKSIFLEIWNFENTFSSWKINIFSSDFFWARYGYVLSKNGIYHSRLCPLHGGPRVAWKNRVFHPVIMTFTTAASYYDSLLLQAATTTLGSRSSPVGSPSGYHGCTVQTRMKEEGRGRDWEREREAMERDAYVALIFGKSKSLVHALKVSPNWKPRVVDAIFE